MCPEKKPRDKIYALLNFAPDGERDLGMRRTFSSIVFARSLGRDLNQHATSPTSTFFRQWPNTVPEQWFTLQGFPYDQNTSLEVCIQHAVFVACERSGLGRNVDSLARTDDGTDNQQTTVFGVAGPTF